MSLISPIGILSFPHLFSPRAAVEGQPPRYSCVLVFTPDVQDTDEFKNLRKELHAAVIAKWGADKTPRGLRSPLRDCSEKDHFANFPEGSLYCNFWSKEQPAVVGPTLQSITVPGDVFAGQKARVSYRPFAYDTSGNRGVSVYLNNVQICSMNEDRLDGRARPENEFGKVEGGGASDALDEVEDDVFA